MPIKQYNKRPAYSFLRFILKNILANGMPQKVSLALRISRQGNSATTDNLYVGKQL